MNFVAFLYLLVFSSHSLLYEATFFIPLVICSFWCKKISRLTECVTFRFRKKRINNCFLGLCEAEMFPWTLMGLHLLFKCRTPSVLHNSQEEHVWSLDLNARVLKKTRRWAHITKVLKSLHWLPVCLRIDFKVTWNDQYFNVWLAERSNQPYHEIACYCSIVFLMVYKSWKPDSQQRTLCRGLLSMLHVLQDLIHHWVCDSSET